MRGASPCSGGPQDVSSPLVVLPLWRKIDRFLRVSSHRHVRFHSIRHRRVGGDAVAAQVCRRVRQGRGQGLRREQSSRIAHHPPLDGCELHQRPPLVIITEPVPLAVGGGVGAGGPPGAGSGPAGQPPRGPGFGALPISNSDYLADEVVVELAANGADQAAQSLARRFRLTQLDAFDIPGAGTRLYRWRIPDRRGAPAVARAIAADRSAASVSLNYIMRLYGEAPEPVAAAPLDQYALT